LDDLMADLEKRKPEGFADMIADAKEAKATVVDGVLRGIRQEFGDIAEQEGPLQKAALAIRSIDTLMARLSATRPEGFERFVDLLDQARGIAERFPATFFNDILRQQSDDLQVGGLIAEGREAEAEALRISLGLMRTLHLENMADLQTTWERAGGEGEIQSRIRDNIEALREQGRAQDALRDKLQPYLNALSDVRSNLTRTIESSLSNPFRGAKDFATGLKQTFNTLFAEDLAEKMFGKSFRDLERRIRETPAEREANQRVTRFAGTVETGSSAVERLTAAFDTAATTITAVTERMATGVPSAVTASAGMSRASTALSIGNPLAKLFVGGDSFAKHTARGSHGVDLRAAVGTALMAPIEGILSQGRTRKGGLEAYVTSLDGRVKFGFAHLSGVMSQLVGQQVKLGQIIGRTGKSGGVDPHLHSSMRIDGAPVDPMAYFGKSLDGFAKAAAPANDNLASLTATVTGLSDVADEAFQEIVVTGRRAVKDIASNAAKLGLGSSASPTSSLSPPQLFGDMFRKLFTQGGLELGLSKEGAERLGSKVGNAVQGVAQAFPQIQAAMAITSQLSSLMGIKNRAGGMFGIGGNLLINAAIPSKRASSSIGFSDGALNFSTTGNSKKFKAGSSEGAESAIGNIYRIAEALGGRITGTGAVSIGIRDGKYRVDPTGKGVTKTGKGAIDFGEDAAAAVKAATLNLIQDGMIAGLRAGTQRLLQNTKDLESGLDKALRFEGVFKELKRRTDPVGAALDELNTRLSSLKQLFTEAGASAEEFADLQKLYDLERAETLEQITSQMTSTLRSLIDDLTVNNDALSLGDRLAMARAKYDPLATEFASGNYAHADAFAEAGRAVEQIIREIEGSQKGYFDFLNSFTDLATKGLAHQEGLIAGAVGGAPGSAGPGAADTAPVVGAIDKLGAYLATELGGHLNAVNDNLGELIRVSAARATFNLESVGRSNF
jgi:murein DD-endopeptidase MepM/ murein hydrolase activator NlpD